MQCHHFDSGECRSCVLLPTPYGDQLASKQRHVESLLADHGDIEWEPPRPGPQIGFRNKAKMVVTGTVTEPRLGILGPDGKGVDLQDCSLHLPGLQAALPLLAEFVTRAELTPYDVGQRRGELKYLIATESPDEDLMVRFVLRSQEPVARIRKHLPWLLQTLPRAVVVSVNLQPEHKAVLEGEREIVLTEQSTLPMRVNDVSLRMRPQSFFQTNTEMAAALYAQARAWVSWLDAWSVWDLYCGVGGFAFHLASPVRQITGVELSEAAVASAQSVATSYVGVEFVAGDALEFARAHETGPALVVVNPPRRGIGSELAGWLDDSNASYVLYSSCNAASLARDLAAMVSLRPMRARLFDMFPNTRHYEVLALLQRG